ncbi:MAG: molybdopterin molybdotransferase MoeA [Desulfurococcaceae archaeon]|nr:molybdopterin molybdotransferase MoeA [Desulfurococcaceae archaeon]
MEKKLRTLLNIDVAVEIMSKRIKIELKEEKLGLVEALYRVSSRDVVSEIDIPFFDRSYVDGYAVRAEDTYGASESNPIVLKVVGKAKPFSSGIVVNTGEAVKVYTGDPLPRGADAVVMLEDVVENGDKIYVLKSLGRYTNVAVRGEDISRGKVLISRGTLIEPKHLAALATVGINEVFVYEKIRICIICTGSEVVEPGAGDAEAILGRGLVFNSTGVLITSYLKTLGFVEPIYMGIVGDNQGDIASLVSKAVDLCHVIVLTGGAGPSDQDMAIDVVESLGGEIVVRGIAMRPGRPSSAGILNNKPIYMLSGFPVAAFLGLKYFVLPSIEKALGLHIPRKIVVAKLVKRVANVAGYTSFVRVKIHKCSRYLCVEPIAAMGSGTISTILDSDGILIVPANVEGFDKGDFVEVELI